MDHEYFYLYRGHYFHQIGCYTLALGNYKKAMNEYGSREHYLQQSIAHCHLALGNYEEALRLYREEYTKSDTPDIVFGLMCAEFNNKNDERVIELYKSLLAKENELDKFHLNEIKRFEKRLKKEKLI